MEYLKYDDYEEMGGTLEEEIYPRHELRARRLIDRITHGRLKEEKTVRECVKYCMFELIGALAADEACGAQGREISSMSNDGVSMSFAGVQTQETRLIGIAKSWLSGETAENGVQLLYAGVDA